MKEIIPGLFLIDNFISPEEASSLIQEIDSQNWLTDLSRRVQHYGWEYDYRSKVIDKNMNLGTLPGWATQLSEKIFKTKYLPYKADQVIVNEYLKNQGISKHIDCVPCFKDGIASLSLLEGWEIIFSNARKEEKYALELYPRSLLILTGEARYQWTHEIPKRASEPNGRVRGRRVSITFRAVQLKD